MIIIDDFVSDPVTRKHLQSDEPWKKQMRFNWKDRDSKSENVFEELCHEVWTNVHQPDDDVKDHGWEYWSHILNPQGINSVPLHIDTDGLGSMEIWEEKKLIEEGVTKATKHGFIYYCHQEKPDGGRLEVKNDDGEVTQVDPIPNRLVIFDPSREHQVTQVTSGERRSFMSNLWPETPRHIVNWIKSRG